MAWHQTGGMPLPEPMMTRIFPQGLNELTHCGLVTPYGNTDWDNLWLGYIGLLPDGIMAPRHYLNQCWLIISEILCHSTEGNIRGIVQDISPWLIWILKIIDLKLEPHLTGASKLTHWGQVQVTHICVSKLTIIGSDNSVSHGRHQAIIWTNEGILLIGPLGTNFSEILIKNCT